MVCMNKEMENEDKYSYKRKKQQKIVLSELRNQTVVLLLVSLVAVLKIWEEKNTN